MKSLKNDHNFQLGTNDRKAAYKETANWEQYLRLNVVKVTKLQKVDEKNIPLEI